jgi:hypothetical protein
LFNLKKKQNSNSRKMLKICILREKWRMKSEAEFNQYGNTNTNTDMVIPVYSKLIPITTLPSRIYAKPILIPISVLTFISNRYHIPIIGIYRYHTYISAIIPVLGLAWLSELARVLNRVVYYYRVFFYSCQK